MACKTFHCDRAEDGSVAVDLVRRLLATTAAAESYDLILIDYQMPHTDGPTTAISEIHNLGYKGSIYTEVDV